jgi:hypothetical protein
MIEKEPAKQETHFLGLGLEYESLRDEIVRRLELRQ